MKLGIYGGTFNPIHLGHVHILKEFIRRLGLEKVLLIPTGTPPHKAAPNLARAKDRLAMCALAAKEITEAPVEVSQIETGREGKSYTADTLAALRGQYPKDELFLLMGEDMFLTVDQWVRPEEICRQAALCVSPRSEDGVRRLFLQKQKLEAELAAHCVIENIAYFPASSTEIRELAGQGKSLSQLVPPEVEAYIAAHGLYREEQR